MDYNKSIACEEIDKLTEELHHLSKKIFKFAEPGSKETKSVRSITRFLKRRNFQVTLNFKGIPTAFKAVYTVSNSTPLHKKPNVALLCRYDAVEKQGHLHGNNLVTEVAVAAALGIQAVIDRSCPSVGTVTVMGCPDSLKGGVVPLINKNAFKDVDLVLMAVPGPRTDWCPVYQGRKTFHAQFKEGEKKGLAQTVRPEGVDAALVAYGNLMTIGQHFGHGWQARVNMGGCPGNYKVKENHRTMDGQVHVCLKTPSNGAMHLMEHRTTPCLEAAAHAFTCDMELKIAHKTLYSFVTNTQLTYLLQLNAYLCGTLATPCQPRPVLGPVDEGNVSHVVPAIRPMFYIGHQAKVGTLEFKAAVHSREAQVYTIAMAKALAMTAVDVFNSGQTLARVKEDLRNSLTEEKETTFKPFPVSKLPSYELRMDTPFDGNVGWSRQP